MKKKPRIENSLHSWLGSPYIDGIPTPLKNMSASNGMMTFPTEWKFIEFHGSSHHQPVWDINLLIENTWGYGLWVSHGIHSNPWKS